MKKLEFGNWDIKTLKGTSEGLSSNYFYREKIKYREVKIDEYRRIEEGIILEYLEKVKGEKGDFKPTQQHLVGYHYISVIDNDNNDKFWIQGNIKSKDKQYCVFIGRGKNAFDVYYHWTNKKKAFEKFLEGLKQNFNVELVLKET